MTKERKIHLIMSIFVFFSVFSVYFITLSPTVTFWDCGEYIACCHRLMVPHPPGSPFYVLIGRLMTMLPLGEDKAYNTNLMGALIGTFTALFAFLVMIKIIRKWLPEELSFKHYFLLYFGPVLGIYIFAFSSTYWQNSTETEVYITSALMLMALAWLSLVWFDYQDKKGLNLLLLLMVYAFGLGFGVHQTLILFIPAFLIPIWQKDKYTVIMLSIFGAFILVNRSILWWLFDRFIYILPGIPGSPVDKIEWNSSSWFLRGLTYIEEFIIGNIVLAGLALWAYFWGKKRKIQTMMSGKLIAIAALIFVLGLLVHLYIPYRSLLDPGIDEGDPETLTGFKSYLQRDQYGELKILQRQAPFIRQLEYYRDYFSWQYLNLEFLGKYFKPAVTKVIGGLFYTLLISLGLWGMWTFYKSDKKRFAFIFGLFFIASFGFIVILNHKDPEVRERDYMWLHSFMLFGVFCGFGLFDLTKRLLEVRNKLKSFPAYVGMVLFSFVPFVTQFESHNYSKNYIAWDYAYNILMCCDKNSFLFTNGDNDTFPLWYLQESPRIRNDVRVMNLSLLQTDWYVRQLRDQEPRVPLTIPDRMLRYWYPMYYEWKKTFTFDRNSPNLVKDVNGNPVLFNTSEIAAADLILHHYNDRSIYYAITCANMMGFKDHEPGTIYDILKNDYGVEVSVVMEGMVFKVRPGTLTEKFDIAKMQYNVDSVYKFRGILNEKGEHDSTVYKDKNIKRLLTNYMANFHYIANHYSKIGLEFSKQDQRDSAIAYFNKASEYALRSLEIKDEDYPEMVEWALNLSREGKNYEQALKYIKKKKQQEKENASWYIYEGVFLNDLQKFSEAESVFIQAKNKFPDIKDSYMGLHNVYIDTKRYDDAIRVWEEWLATHPNDEDAKNSTKSEFC